jgi:hypothetical protein
MDQAMGVMHSRMLMRSTLFKKVVNISWDNSLETGRNGGLFLRIPIYPDIGSASETYG